jgi:hypothetical protein
VPYVRLQYVIHKAKYNDIKKIGKFQNCLAAHGSCLEFTQGTKQQQQQSL